MFLWQSGLTLSSDGILGPLTSDLPVEGLDLSDIPLAEDVEEDDEEEDIEDDEEL